MNKNSIKYRRFLRWSTDAGERAVKSFAQGVLVAVPLAADSGVSIQAFLEWEPWAAGLGMAALSLLTSLASRKSGSVATGSLVD
jgi:hypothetical protein